MRRDNLICISAVISGANRLRGHAEKLIPRLAYIAAPTANPGENNPFVTDFNSFRIWAEGGDDADNFMA